MIRWLRIGEVSKRFGIPKSTLRWYYTHGVLPAQQRGSGRHLYYGPYEMRWIEMFLELRKILTLREFVDVQEVLRKSLLFITADEYYERLATSEEMAEGLGNAA